jgi:hypothetical protein
VGEGEWVRESPLEALRPTCRRLLVPALPGGLLPLALALATQPLYSDIDG